MVLLPLVVLFGFRLTDFGVFVSINSDGELWRVMIKSSGGPFCRDFDGDV
jgi:hypothetical protein